MPNEVPTPREMAAQIEDALEAALDNDFIARDPKRFNTLEALARCLREAEVSVVGGTPQRPKLLLVIPLDRWNG